MEFTIYLANCVGNAQNNIYPRKKIIRSAQDLVAAVRFDHVCASYKNNHRCGNNYLFGDVDVLDNDNDHSENPSDWLYPQDYERLFPDVQYVYVPSRNSGKPKGNKSARPRGHIYFPHERITSSEKCAELKKRIHKIASFFDANALDSARFIYGCNITEINEIVWHEGSKTIEEYLAETEFIDFDRESEKIKEGARNSTMSRLAGKIIKRFGNTEQAKQIFLEKAMECSPPLDNRELSSIWTSAVKFGKKLENQEGYIPPEEYNKPPEWEIPIPFDEYNLPSFPVDCLPKAVGDYVKALSESTQTPVDMAATSAIAVLSVCMQGKFKIQAKPDWTEPVNTFVLDVMDPSERKSAVQNAMIRPLNLYESEQNSRNAGAIESSKMQKRILERRQKALEDMAAKGKADAEEVTRIAEEIASYKEMKPLKLYVDDITTEKLTSVLASNDGRAAILSTEGGIFDTLSGAYSKTVNIDVMLKGYSGDSIRVDRIGRNSESIMNPALTVLLMVQPSVLSGLMQNGTFRGRGLTARFLYCIPTSFVGRRKYRSTPVPDDVYLAYDKCIRNLLEDEYEGKAEIITLSKEADGMIEEFAETLEPKLKNSYADIADWAGKLVGNVLRISALLCRASVHRSHEFLTEPKPLEVDAEQVKKAIRIGNYFVEHAKAAFLMMGADPIVRQSKLVVEKVRINGLEEFTVRDIMRLCRTFKKAEDVQLVLKRLLDYGYLAEKQNMAYSGKGRPPAQVYLVNPYIYEKA